MNAKKVSLEKFKAGLIDLGLCQRGRGSAYIHHLFAVALHVSAGSHKKALQELWQSVRQIAGTNAVVKSQFQAWYATL